MTISWAFEASNSSQGQYSAEDQAIAAVSSPCAPKSMGKILVVHDRLNSLSFMHDVLSEAGYSMFLTMDRQGTVEAATAEAPDLVLLDISSPDTDGHLICQQLKSNPKTRDIPIIVVSAINDILTLSKFISMRVNGFIHKPFQLDDFLGRIQRQITLA